MAIIIFIVVLAFLILFHEIGHFLFAKLAGMRVDEFGVGFPPKLFRKKIGETEYSINTIPFGGYVKILGENPEEGVGDERSFTSKRRSLQILVLAGGVLFNFLLACILLSAGFMFGMPVSSTSALGSEVKDAKFTVVGISENSPAEKSGLQVGDQILYVESNGVEVQGDELNAESFQNTIVSGDGAEVAIMIKRVGEADSQLIVLEPSFEIVPDRPAIGVSTDKIGTLRLSFFRSIKEGVVMSASVFVSIVVGLWTLISEAFTGGGSALSQVTGPIGIIGFIGDASTLGFTYLISFVAFISLNLAVINLIPFPALDGGRILFVFIEILRGRPISPKVSNILNAAGFLILMALMVLVTYNDITRLI